MTLGIRGKLFVLSFALIGCTLVAGDFYLSAALKKRLTTRIRDDLFVRVDMVEHDASLFEASVDANREWHAFSLQIGRLARTRVTVVRRDGTVIGDSAVEFDRLAQMKNLARHREIVNALTTGQGESVRFDNKKTRLLYAAKPFYKGAEIVGVVRLTIPLTEVDKSVTALHRLLFITSFIAIFVSILIYGFATQLAARGLRKLTSAAKTMEAGDLSVQVPVTGRGEFAHLGRALDRLAKSLSRSMADLRSERDLLDGILTGMREGILLLDRDGRLTLVNRAFREMFLVRSDIVGQPLLEAIRHAELKALLDQAVASQEPVSGEIEVKGLKPRRLLVHASKADSERGTLLVFVDVTDIRRLESLRRDFVANASHELRTPVASARSALETLRIALENDPDAVNAFLDIIDRNIERLHHLIVDLLDLSRIESREFKLVFEPVLLHSVVETTLARFSDKASQKQARIFQSVPADLPAVRADRRAVEQILANLVDNAIQYSPSGAEVKVSTTVEESTIRIAVEDTGPGIEPEHLPRLFERFYRVDPGRSRELGGTGLGLSIVKHLVETMGGTVNVDSTVAKGSTFSFTLRRF